MYNNFFFFSGREIECVLWSYSSNWMNTVQPVWSSVLAGWIQYNLSDPLCLLVEYSKTCLIPCASWLNTVQPFWSYVSSWLNTVQPVWSHVLAGWIQHNLYDPMFHILCFWNSLQFVLTITSTYFILVLSNYHWTIILAYCTYWIY